MLHVDILLQAFCINSLFFVFVFVFFFLNEINLYGVDIQIQALG